MQCPRFPDLLLNKVVEFLVGICYPRTPVELVYKREGRILSGFN